MPLQGTREPPRLSRLQVSSTAPRQGTTEALRSDELTFLINHIFLPPKLPQAEESSTTKKDRILVKALKAAAEKYRDVEGVHGKERMVIVGNMLSSYLAIKSSGQGAISAAILGEKIRDMKSGGNGNHVCFYILISRQLISLLYQMSLHWTFQRKMPA
jgi:hypothetical protein